MLERKKILVERVIHIVSDWLKEERIFTSPLVKCRHGKSGEGKLFINVTQISAGSLLIQEGYSLSDGENRIHRSWSFLKEGSWDVAGLEKNGRPVVIRHLQKELDDLLSRLEVVGQVVCPIGFSYDEEMEDIGLDLVVPYELRPESKLSRAYSNFVSWDGWRSPVFYAVAAMGFMAFFGTILFFLNFYSFKVNQQNLFESAAARLEKEINVKMQNLDSRQEGYDNQSAEMEELKVRLAQSDDLFISNFSMLVTQRARELPSWEPFRRRAYQLIAQNIGESSTSSEILYEWYRLPQTEMQAGVFLETNSGTVVTLSHYTPAIESLIFPVQVSRRENDGKGFRITSGYMAKRIDPLGSGGTHPHHAVDIMNVSNIRRINKDGKLDREGMPNGDIVTVESGVVTAAFSSSIYGYLIEIRHPMTSEIREKFPDATGWRSFYAHMITPSVYKVGDKVEVGDKLGEIGNSGTSSGPHLHFEIRLDIKDENGRTVTRKINPYPGSEEVDFF